MAFYKLRIVNSGWNMDNKTTEEHNFVFICYTIKIHASVLKKFCRNLGKGLYLSSAGHRYYENK
jgi:hypothetical protein